jgi:hypothetical protein
VDSLSSLEDSKILLLKSILMGLLNSPGEQALGHMVLVASPLKDLAIME